MLTLASLSLPQMVKTQIMDYAGSQHQPYLAAFCRRTSNFHSTSSFCSGLLPSLGRACPTGTRGLGPFRNALYQEKLSYLLMAQYIGNAVLPPGMRHTRTTGMREPQQTGLLTVGESPGFLKSGGVINFYLQENRVHFEIQPSAAHSSGLHVSAQLLKLVRTL